MAQKGEAEVFLAYLSNLEQVLDCKTTVQDLIACEHAQVLMCCGTRK